MFSKNKNSEIGLSKGWMKWINKFFRFVLYPFIHPKTTIFLLLIIATAVLVPLLVYKVEFKAIPDWYKELLEPGYQKVVEFITPYKDEAMQKYDPITDKSVKKASEAKNKKQSDIIEYDNQPQAPRATFQSDEAETPLEPSNEVVMPSSVDVKHEAESPAASTDEEKPNIYFKRNNSLGLNYLETPEEINGRFTIINANEALIGSQAVFLYGIYTPAPKMQQASKYMLDNYDGKKLKCYIGAYTSDNHATAICFDGEISINHDLVKQGFAQNVSLY